MIMYLIRLIEEHPRLRPKLGRSEGRVESLALHTVLFTLGEENTPADDGGEATLDSSGLLIDVVVLEDVSQGAEVGGEEPRTLEMNTMISSCIYIRR
jgi:hypothetical protein